MAAEGISGFFQGGFQIWSDRLKKKNNKQTNNSKFTIVSALRIIQLVNIQYLQYIMCPNNSSILRFMAGQEYCSDPNSYYLNSPVKNSKFIVSS